MGWRAQAACLAHRLPGVRRVVPPVGIAVEMTIIAAARRRCQCRTWRDFPKPSAASVASVRLSPSG
jgi:hypothetical protein